MEKAVFTDEMLEMIKSTKGKIFKSYETSPLFHGTPVCFYGNCRINLGRESIEITNYLYRTQFPGSEEEVSCFGCERVDRNSNYKPYIEKHPFEYMVNERIKSVALVKDIVSVDNGGYEIEFDMALIIRTTHNVYTFTRDWYYDESVSIVVDPEEERPFELDEELKQWGNIQENVKISRRIVEL